MCEKNLIYKRRKWENVSGSERGRVTSLGKDPNPGGELGEKSDCGEWRISSLSMAFFRRRVKPVFLGPKPVALTNP